MLAPSPLIEDEEASKASLKSMPSLGNLDWGLDHLRLTIDNDVFGRAKLSGKVSLTDRLFVSISGFFLPRTCGFLCGLTVTLLKEIIYSGGYKKGGGGG